MIVSKNFAKDYTGIDTLIRIDGYYYRENISESKSLSPFILSKNSEIQAFFFIFKSHEDIKQYISSQSKPFYGNYVLMGDTIKIRWAEKYDLGSYRIFSEQYVIVNDTTLKKIWFLCETCDNPDGRKIDSTRNEIYKFFKFP